MSVVRANHPHLNMGRDNPIEHLQTVEYETVHGLNTSGSSQVCHIPCVLIAWKWGSTPIVFCASVWLQWWMGDRQTWLDSGKSHTERAKSKAIMNFHECVIKPLPLLFESTAMNANLWLPACKKEGKLCIYKCSCTCIKRQQSRISLALLTDHSITFKGFCREKALCQHAICMILCGQCIYWIQSATNLPHGSLFSRYMCYYHSNVSLIWTIHTLIGSGSQSRFNAIPWLR